MTFDDATQREFNRAAEEWRRLLSQRSSTKDLAQALYEILSNKGFTLQTTPQPADALVSALVALGYTVTAPAPATVSATVSATV
ncbi:MAG TPA: hypothetical protein VF501_06670 [Thiobacillus sp.]